jgi:hypothetical protein
LQLASFQSVGPHEGPSGELIGLGGGLEHLGNWLEAAAMAHPDYRPFSSDIITYRVIDLTPRFRFRGEVLVFTRVNQVSVKLQGTFWLKRVAESIIC